MRCGLDVALLWGSSRLSVGNKETDLDRRRGRNDKRIGSVPGGQRNQRGKDSVYKGCTPDGDGDCCSVDGRSQCRARFAVVGVVGVG